MKTFTAVLVTVLASSGTAAAQSSRSHAVRGGVQAGAALAKVSSLDSPSPDDSFGASLRAGASAGVFVIVPADAHLAFQPEALYVQKGSTLTDPAGGAQEASVRLTYLEVPLLVRWESTRTGAAPFLVVGPTVGWNLDARVDASASGGARNLDVSNRTRTLDAGLAVGGGVAFGRGFVQGRVVQGLLDIGEPNSVNGPVRTRTISVLAGIGF